ncbi:MAG: metabolite traffic protein EboE [Myxococcales bacterium]|nr:metabolite traffic protein EboE [Myxococcales bacterium]
MRIPADASVHLTYCTNVHPGETWPEVRSVLRNDVLAVKRAFCPTEPFGVGLRLAARAAAELVEGDALPELQAILAEQDMYVVSINGFPHGAFHGQTVKERVYLPDWRDPARVRYSDHLSEILAALLPADEDYGSISTVPGAFKAAVEGPQDMETIVDNLVRHAAQLVRLRERTGRMIVLALEPEPGCVLETIAEVTDFFERHLRTERAFSRLAQETGLSRQSAERALTSHIGVCVDTCHAAVEFEDSAALVEALARASIQIAKLQLSSALRIEHMTNGTREALLPYLDRVYLHQVVERLGSGFNRYADLCEALEHHAWQSEDAEWRVHFHVPVFLEQMKRFGSTRGFLQEMLALQRQRRLTHHLEVETYTWDVLPDEMQATGLTTSIERELRFCLSELSAIGQVS